MIFVSKTPWFRPLVYLKVARTCLTLALTVMRRFFQFFVKPNFVYYIQVNHDFYIVYILK
jgi:hypothetical protein